VRRGIGRWLGTFELLLRKATGGPQKKEFAPHSGRIERTPVELDWGLGEVDTYVGESDLVTGFAGGALWKKSEKRENSQLRKDSGRHIKRTEKISVRNREGLESRGKVSAKTLNNQHRVRTRGAQDRASAAMY